MTTAYLVRDDGGGGAVLDLDLVDGSIEWLASELAEHPLASRDDVADHLYRRARSVSLRCIFGEAPPVGGFDDGRVGGPRWLAVLAFLEEARDEGATVTLYLPQRPAVGPLVVLAVREEITRYADLRITIDLREARIASLETVELSAIAGGSAEAAPVVAGSTSGPVGEAAAGFAESSDEGSRSTSLLVAIGNSLGVL